MTNKPCAWPGCKAEGTFAAPKNPRDLTERQYFCAVHIKEFNKSWNGLEGFEPEEITQLQQGAATWNRPTWSLGSSDVAALSGAFDSAEDLYRFFKQRHTSPQKSAPEQAHPPDVQEACHIMGLSQPVVGQPLKQRYLELIKKHHPDISDAPDAAELVKRINVAMTILTAYAEK